nr:GntR family transcriptional regulator [Streptomyces sp. SID8499]
MRVAELIRSGIASGDLPSGSRIPCQSYAAEFGVSLETVKRACDRLRDAGILVRGHGYRVPDGVQIEYGTLRLPLNGRPGEAADVLRSAMTDDQLAALIAALQAPAG